MVKHHVPNFNLHVFLNAILKKQIFVKHYTEDLCLNNRSINHHYPLVVYLWHHLKEPITAIFAHKLNLAFFSINFCRWKDEAQVCLSIFYVFFVHIIIQITPKMEWYLFPSQKASGENPHFSLKHWIIKKTIFITPYSHSYVTVLNIFSTCYFNMILLSSTLFLNLVIELHFGGGGERENARYRK